MSLPMGELAECWIDPWEVLVSLLSPGGIGAELWAMTPSLDGGGLSTVGA